MQKYMVSGHYCRTGGVHKLRAALHDGTVCPRQPSQLLLLPGSVAVLSGIVPRKLTHLQGQYR